MELKSEELRILYNLVIVEKHNLHRCRSNLKLTKQEKEFINERIKKLEVISDEIKLLF